MQMPPLLHREPGRACLAEAPSWMTACIQYGRMTSHGESGRCSCVSEELVTSIESICNVSNYLLCWFSPTSPMPHEGSQLSCHIPVRKS